MQKIDAGYLYELGAIIRPMRGLGFGKVSDVWHCQSILLAAHEAIQQFIAGSIYREALRTSPHYGRLLLMEIERVLEELRKPDYGNPEKTAPFGVFHPMSQAFDKFEPVMVAELQAASIFFVPPKGGFDTEILIEDGMRLFPDSVRFRAPETENDLSQAAKCLAFNLPTAAGFHLHRANEAVLRRYFDKVAGIEKRPKVLSMGSLLGALKKQEVGDKRIITALDNIKEFHRNPLMHPEHTLEDSDEAISLYCAVRAAMGYMLEELEVDFVGAMEAGDHPNLGPQ